MTVPLRFAARLYGAAIVLWLASMPAVLAFPLLDPSNEAQVPNGTNLPPADLTDLRHQLQLANGLAAPAGGGWTILPRIDIEEMFNDNVYQANSPRRWDLVTLISPGIAIAGDLPRVQVALDYSPTLELYTRTGSQDGLDQQLTATALVTAIPDLAYVDLRALAGVTAANGLLGAVGTGGVGGIEQNNATAVPTNTAEGVAKQNRTQTSSFEISPYLLRRFGDYGTGKLGVSATESQYQTSNGFTALPFPTGTGNGTKLRTTEEFGQFTSGEVLGRFQDTFSIDLTQSTSASNQLVNFNTGAASAIPSTTTRSSRQIVSDQLGYAVNHWATVFASIGHEDIRYSQIGTLNIDDMTWSVGTTLLPNPDSSITVSYGHQNGANSVQANGYYAITARTVINGSYTSSVGTALEQVQQQVQAELIGPNGQAINGANGQPLLFPAFQLGIGQAVYRYNTLSLNLQTSWERDIVTLGIVWSQQTSTGASGSNGSLKTGIVQWQHALSPDLLLNTSLAYTQQTSNGGVICFGVLPSECTSNAAGTTGSLAVGAILQYTINETLSAHLRYLFYDRNSPQASNRMYQNLIVVGFTKQF